MRLKHSDFFVLTVMVLAVAKAVLTRYLALGSTNIPVGVVLEMSAIVLFICLVDVLPRRRQPLLTVGAYTALVFLMWANLIYIRAFDQIVDPGMLQAAGQVGTVADMVVDLMLPVHLFYILDIPLLLLWASDLVTFETPRPRRSKLFAAVGAVALVLTVIQVGIVARIPAAMDSIAVARRRGLSAYQIASFARGEDPAYATVAAPPPAGSSELSPGAVMQQRIDALRSVEPTGRVEGVASGAYANANVIMIQVEALQEMAYGSFYEGQEITPNLNKMADDSWVCTNAFSQSGVGNTSDSEFTANTSLLQPVGKAAVLEYVDREIPSIPRLLNDKGYRTVTMHGNDVAFWNRKELYASLGFQQYYDRADIGTVDQMYRGASDEAFFAAAQRIILNDLGRQKPLYANLITMSSHAPYTHVPYDRRPIQVSESLRESKAANWVGAISYADMALGEFLGWLKETGLYDTSIVIVYGDHQAIKELDITGADKQIVETLLGHRYTEVDRQKVPLLIHLPGQTEGGAINSTVGITDIAPTVADLLGVDMSETPHLGRSVFATPADPLVITRGHFPAGSLINDRVAFMPELTFEDGTALRLADGGKVTPSATEKADFERALELSRLSEQWVRSLPIRPDAGDIKDAVIPKGVKRVPGE